MALGGNFTDRYFVDFTRDIEAARTRLATRRPDVVLSALPPGMPFSLLEEANLREESPIVIVLANAGDGGRIAEAFDRGARGYLPLPLDRRLVDRVIARELERAEDHREVETLRSQMQWDEVQIPGSSLEEIEKVAILRSLQATGGSTGRAARMLGISVRKIQYRLREWRRTAPHLLAARYPSDPSSPDEQISRG
jgi:DNA-binding NtrC family response regulator